jgi:hypothetical protein
MVEAEGRRTWWNVEGIEEKLLEFFKIYRKSSKEL